MGPKVKSPRIVGGLLLLASFSWVVDLPLSSVIGSFSFCGAMYARWCDGLEGMRSLPKPLHNRADLLSSTSSLSVGALRLRGGGYLSPVGDGKLDRLEGL